MIVGLTTEMPPVAYLFEFISRVEDDGRKQQVKEQSVFEGLWIENLIQTVSIYEKGIKVKKRRRTE